MAYWDFFNWVRNSQSELDMLFQELARIDPNNKYVKKLGMLVRHLGQAVYQHSAEAQQSKTTTASIKQDLVKLANKLDGEGKTEIADIIDIMLREI